MVEAVPWDDQISEALAGLDELLVHGLHGADVLLDHGIHRSAPFLQVTLETANEAEVAVGVDEHPEVHQLAQALVEAVPSIQLAIRLLIPPGSLLLELAEVQELVGPLDEAALVHPWSNPHPGADALQAEVQRLVQRGAEMPRRAVFESVWLAANAAARRPAPALPTGSGGGPPPHLSEAWYCCAEPSDEQTVGV